MQNFNTKLSNVEKTLNNIRGIFDKYNVESNLQNLEKKDK